MNIFKTFLLISALTVLLVWIGGLIGGSAGALVAFIISLLINGISWWFSDKIVLSIYKAHEMDKGSFPRVYDIVKGLSKASAIPEPRIFVIESKAANAFATGRNPQNGILCLTTGIIELLDDEELKGVLSHEIGHIKNRDTLIMTVTAAIASAIMMLSNMARWSAILGGGSRGTRRGSGNIVGLIAVSIIAPIAALLIQLAISRSREFGADAMGAKIAGTPKGLANALESLTKQSKNIQLDADPATAHLFIVSPLSAASISNLFSTHPPIEERVKRLRSMV